MDTLTVSVIIPAYNREHTLPDAINSVLAQTIRPLEVIVVDDGSTDGTSEVCAGYSSRLRYIWQENAGVSAARNRGIAEAQGALVAFLDSDDAWEPQKLEVQLSAFQHWPRVGWSATDSFRTDDDFNLRNAKRGFPNGFPIFAESGLRPAELFRRSLESRVLHLRSVEHTAYVGDAFGLLFLGNFVLPSSLVVRSELLGEVGGFDESFRLAEETELVHRLAARAEAAVIMTPLVRWRIGRGDSLISPGNTERLVTNALKSVDRAARLRTLTDAEKRLYRRGRKKLLLRLAYARLSNLDRTGARDALRRARRSGRRPSLRELVLRMATHVPRALLEGAARLKRALG